MTPRDAAELLAMMQATWSGLADDDIANRLWLGDLAGRANTEAACAAFRQLRDEQDRAPAWSKFLRTYRAIVGRAPPHRRAITASADDWTPPTEEQKARLHALLEPVRANLQRRSAEVGLRTRWHPPAPPARIDPELPLDYGAAGVCRDCGGPLKADGWCPSCDDDADAC
jgi:hypothetical protein